MGCERRHVIVTGADSGIGEATASRLAQAGFHVLRGSRRDHSGDPGKDWLALDVTDPDEIAVAAEQVSDHVGEAGLDALVNVAGIGFSEPLEVLALDRLRQSFEVNTVGQLGLTQAMLPLLRTAQGRIVFVGSIGDRMTVPYAGPLTSSKWAVAALAFTLRQELAPWNIEVVLVEPASIHTPAVEEMERAVEQTISSWTPEQQALYEDSFTVVMAKFLEGEKRGSPPSKVAEIIEKALTVDHPKDRYLVGKDAHRLALVAQLPQTLQDAARRRLFGLPERGSAVE